MAHRIKDHFERLKGDDFRKSTPFSREVEEATVALLRSGSHEESVKILSAWLATHQPCLFGRIAARVGGLRFCFLNERDLLNSDEVVQQKIQEARRSWRRSAFNGDASGFLIVVISDRIARAIPDNETKSIAKRICYLYLGRDDEDDVLLEDVFLRVPGKEDAEIQWKAGVNFFSAQADGRWWHDHRIPGGMAFSMNSVGHMVKSFEVGRQAEEMWTKLGLDKQDWSNMRVDSLGKALVTAMLTIDNAAETNSGKATRLLDTASEQPARCPIELPSKLKNKNSCEYFGYYHTDFTIPSDYFRPDVDRPSEIKGYSLDFTYLFDDEIENAAFAEMGRGIRVRHQVRFNDGGRRRPSPKRERVIGKEGLIKDHPTLKGALEEL